MADLTILSQEELSKKLATAKSIRIIVGAIFAVIILAWVVLGYWKEKTPLFISTIVLAGVSLLPLSQSIASINRELAKRSEA